MAHSTRPVHVALCSLVVGWALGHMGDAKSADAHPRDAEIPIKRIVMYTSGVGFFERGGKVQDDAAIELRFGTRDINDLLKSLVLEDLDGGQVSAVSYTGQNQVGRSLKTFSVDLSHSPSMANLLRQVRGERVRISGPNSIEGRILGVEERRQIDDNGVATSWEVLNLLTEDGLRSVSLDDAQDIRLLDAKLNAELQEALVLLTKARGNDKKVVTLSCTGKGERRLRVGYIQETPVWKTSYRLLLRDKEKPFLQGWAIVENTSDHDWKDVHLHLVSGRPVSFIMDLYEPLFAQRPVVRPDLFDGLQSRRHGQDLMAAAPPVQQGAGFGAGGIGGAPAGMGGRGFGGFGAGGIGGMGGGGGNPFGGGQSVEDEERHANVENTSRSVADAGEVGELFRYAITTPVTLARQQSAMLPIVNEVIAGEKIGIYNAATEATHPLTAFRLKNSTKLHLMQGPISVFDSGEYAGDAQIADVAPGAERLVSYALDLDTEVTATPGPSVKTVVSVSVFEGVLTTVEKHVRSTQYQLKNSGDAAKTVLVEQPLDRAWRLTSPHAASEQTRSLYRFAVKVPAAGMATLEVKETREHKNDLVFGELTEDHIAFYLDGTVASDDIKAALNKLRELRADRSAKAAMVVAVRAQIAEIETEQSRIRANMDSLHDSSDLFTRYVKKLNDQEDTIEALRTDLAKLLKAEAAAAKALGDFVAKPPTD